MSAVAHLLNRELTGYRDVLTSNGTGGYSTVRMEMGVADARVVPAGMTEAVLAQQGQARVTHILYFNADTDVQRLDEWEDTERGHTYEVIATVEPSPGDVYLKAQANRQQAAPDTPEVI